MNEKADDVAEIEELVHTYARNFLDNNGGAQLGLWDAEYPNLTLMPSEQAAPLKSWDEIEKFYTFWTGSEGGPKNSIKRWEVTDVTADRLSEDLGFALALVVSEYDMAVEVPSDFLFPGYGGENGVWVGRLNFVVRRSDSRWKIIHYEDSTQDLFRAHQLWDYHRGLAERAMKVLSPILNPPVGP